MNPLDWTKKLLGKSALGSKAGSAAGTKNSRADNLTQQEFGFEQIQVKVVRRRGVKNLTLRFMSENDISVTVPWRVSKEMLIKFLESKKEWIEEQQKVFAKWTPWQSRKGMAGEQYYYLGQVFELRYGLTLLNQIVIQADPSHPGAPVIWCHWPEKKMKDELSFEQAFKALQKYFRLEAERIITPRIALLAEQIGVAAPTRVRFRSQRSRWGSCSSRGSISLNRKLIGAPLKVIDSVIIHELCHLKHLNHSAEFWALVNRHCPDHLESDQWLNEHQLML